MLFTSPLFLFIFLPAFLAAYYLTPDTTRSRNAVALMGSVVFFAWGEPLFVFALIAGTLIDYWISLAIAPNAPRSIRIKRLLLAFGIALNVGWLIAAKYVDFIVTQIINPLTPWTGLSVAPPHIPLLLGISFITFHRISYLIDSFNGRAVPPRGFLDCALYIFLFPQLIAGPIIRYHDIGAQIHHRTHSAEDVLLGFVRFGVGMAKKLLIADPLGIAADRLFGLPTTELSVAYAWGGALAYTLQIYFDFSGYSDMAIGLGRMMGFRFPENFNRPYISRSITEFWRRWHISLSSWMRLYLYIPLGGNRGARWRTYFNLWIVFVISGFWHGASWNFIAWGAYFGALLSIERAAGEMFPGRRPLPSAISQILTLLLVMFGWVLFRAPDLTHAVQYLTAMFGGNPPLDPDPRPWGLVFGNRELATMIVGLLIACLPWPDKAPGWHWPQAAAWSDRRTIARASDLWWLFLTSLSLLVISAAATVSADYVPFLYFRF